MTMFGIALAPLYAAIAQVESDRGATSANVYQIREIYVADVNRILRNPRYRLAAPFTLRDRLDRFKSRAMMEVYWAYYGERYRRLTGREPTAEVLARIHNGGPDGWRKTATLPYWRKVNAAMERRDG